MIPIYRFGVDPGLFSRNYLWHTTVVTVYRVKDVEFIVALHHFGARVDRFDHDFSREMKVFLTKLPRNHFDLERKCSTSSLFLSFIYPSRKRCGGRVLSGREPEDMDLQGFDPLYQIASLYEIPLALPRKPYDHIRGKGEEGVNLP